MSNLVPRESRERLERAAGSVPGLARVAASAAWHTTGWGVRTGLRSSRRVARAATSADEAAALIDDVTETVGVVGDLARRFSAGIPVGRALMEAGAALGGLADEGREPGSAPAYDGAGSFDGRPLVHGSVVGDHRNGHRNGHHEDRSEQEQQTLRELGQDLLRRSRDVWATDGDHPAYQRILTELAPDEGRILLLLLEGGPQPSVDVRTGGPVGMLSSQLVAPGLTMIGSRAGCRHGQQVPSYLNNLFRLGLVWFSREPLRDPLEYQVVEAQPDVLAALHSVRFAKVVRRSIHLTPFGEDFCRACLVVEEARAASFPQHATPDTGDPGSS
ncbi:Abi-alpha family protein [Lapillicoccus sp.]|uniref:Abi-alpha family protein n=1 Tax=Lapillicoccus sp. TaxID=1909287 RepID=UPI003983C9AD